MSSVADLFWVRMPTAVRRVSFTLAASLADGGYLRAWPPVAAAAPVVAVVLGLLLGAVHPGPLYSYSVIVVTLLAVVGAFGAGLGLVAWAGFVLTDLLVSDRSTIPSFGYGSRVLLTGYLPLLLTYLLLAMLMVFVPLLSAGFAARTRPVLRGRGFAGRVVGQVVHVCCAGGLTFAWAEAMPFMIRPLWSFGGATPDTTAVQPVQGHIPVLVAIVILAALGRALLVLIAARRPSDKRPAPLLITPIRSGPREVRRLVLVPVQALISVLLLAGLVDAVWQGVLLWLVLTAILYVRLLLVPRIPGYLSVVRRVPVLIRLVGCAFFAFALTSVVVEPAVQRGESSFFSLVVVVCITLILAAFLLPAQQLAAPPPAAGGSTGRASRTPTWADPTPPRRRGRRGPADPAARLRLPGRLGHPLVRRVAAALTAGVLIAVATTSPAAADNCSGLSDCSFGVKVALVVAAIAVVLILWWLLPEIIGAGAAEVAGEAAVEGAAEAAAEGAAEAAAEGAAEAAAEGGAEAAAEGGAEAAAEGGAEGAAEGEAAAEAGTEFTEGNLNDVADHLAREGMDHSPANDAMIERIKTAIDEGRALTEGETNFMNHELTEKALMDEGMSYEEAHEIAMQEHPPFKNYDPEVIDQFPDLFNNNWRNAWGLGPK